MRRKLRRRTESEESGFSLIELLVVVLIIGLLAAIALPAFLSQREKGQDADAKSNARNLVTAVESCYADTHDYGSCEAESGPGAKGDVTEAGIPLGSGAGSTEVVDADTDDNSFRIVAHSRSGNDFTATKTNGASPVRTCSGDGGCDAGTW